MTMDSMELAQALAENEKLREANKQLVSGIYTITRRKQEENERLREELAQALAENEKLRAELRWAIKELADCQQLVDYLAGSDR